MIDKINCQGLRDSLPWKHTTAKPKILLILLIFIKNLIPLEDHFVFDHAQAAPVAVQVAPEEGAGHDHDGER